MVVERIVNIYDLDSLNVAKSQKQITIERNIHQMHCNTETFMLD